MKADHPYNIHMYSAHLIRQQLIGGSEGTIPDENRKMEKKDRTKANAPLILMMVG